MSEKFDEITNIDRIEFTLYGNEEIKRASAVINDTFGINIAETYDLMEPKRGGLVDPRLGTTDSQMLCATCGLEYKYCPGHFGHTELAEPVFHIGFINIVKNILGCVCIRCSKLLLNKSLDEINTVIRNKYGKVRFAEVRKLTSSIKYCQRQDYSCGAPVPIITKKFSPTQGSIHLQAETELSGVTEEDGGNSETGKKRVIEILKPKTIYTIMKNISDLDYQIMGFDTSKARPEDMIIINFPIPPNAIRPAAKRDFLSTTSFEDTLTHKLSDIVKSNIKLRKLLDKETASGEDIKYSQDYVQHLQYHIATYYNNEEVPLPISQQKTGGRPIKSIAERISGKTGRIRQNLNGKRVEGSGRAVITSDPNIGIDEVGIPLKIAMSIPFPETVTPDNYEKLSQLVRNGRDIYPGVNKVIKKNGVSYDIRYRNRPIKLQYGDIVERHLVDGDYVLFNRQPSLHKLSMMGHRVRVSLNPKFTTFSMNPSTCKPYNADFDGDEMNVFVPQTIQSVVELSMLANVTSLIISPRNTEPIIELRQDSVLGNYLLTETDQPLSWNRIMETLMVTKNLDFGKISKSESGTFDMMSYLIPDINLSMGGVKVENGDYKSGKVTSKALNNANGFIGIIYDQYGGDITRDFIDNVQKVVLSWLYKKGFTVGIRDCILENKILSEIKDKTNKLMLEVKHLITEQENHPGLLAENIFEDNMATMLSAHAGNMGKIAMDNINHDNNFYIMVNSGAKGKVESIGHIACIVGQINMNNKRIAKKVNNRTLPHYAQFDDTPHARGFVTSSYMKGLRPAEFFFLTMAGRDGLIDTAIKSVTGDTPIVIYEAGNSTDSVVKYVTIGDWIDAQLEQNKDKVQHFEEREMEYLELDRKISIPTTDADGNVTWGAITAITRHLPGKELYEIKTAGGKKVIVTESKSLLIYNSEKKQFLHTATPDVKLGDFVPVTLNLPKIPGETKSIDISKVDYSNLTLDLCLELLCANEEVILEFLEKVNITETTEQSIKNVIIMLQNITQTYNSNFTSQNDVILDEIVEINKIDVNLYPKVYDLTIPSTLNFGLANGLHVVDTADTGYIQRKFIKGMEDVMIYYDGLVRSANNQIIQYFYGGSNLDQVKQKPVKISLINMNNAKVREELVFTKDELKSMYKKGELLKIEPMNEKYYKKLIEFRDELRQIVLRATGNYATIRDEFMLPVNLHRIINSKIDNSSKVIASKDIVEYDEVINTIEEIIKSENTKMFCMKESERKQETSYKQDLENINKFMFIISIYEYLSPKKCMLKYKLTKKSLEEVKNEIIHNFNKAIVDPGEMVGVLGAQSMGEKSTQLNLNTKHSAGAVKKGTSGVARMNEILRCTKNIKTPMLTIYLDDKYKYSKESAYKIASYISYLTLQDIVLKGDIGFDPDVKNGYLKQDNIDINSAMQIYDTKLELKKLPWMFRFSINRDMLYAKKLKLSEIKINFVKFWKSKLNTSKVNNKTEKDIYSRVVSCAILSSNENDPEPVIHIRFELNNYDVNKIIELQDYILSNFNLKGLDGITSIDVLSQSQVEIEKDGSMDNKDQYILLTEGINMSGIRGILGIDHEKTITNDMYSIYANFGIEAVRNKLINEISGLIDNVNYHHISLLIDVMTHSGSLISIDRHGINRQDTDPLSRASFEKTMEQFINAAAFNETDKLKSVSSRIIIGRMINGGTGYCQLMMDNDILENTELNVSSIQQGMSQSDDMIKLEDNMIIDDLIMKDSEMFIV
jgi:DNA-directed RNA polymerase beta' subunit